MAKVVELILIQIKSGEPTVVLKDVQVKEDSVSEIVDIIDENAM